MTLLVMLVSATTWAQPFTVTLQSGDGSGDDITIIPDCPNTFSYPDGDRVLVG